MSLFSDPKCSIPIPVPFDPAFECALLSNLTFATTAQGLGSIGSLCTSEDVKFTGACVNITGQWLNRNRKPQANSNSGSKIKLSVSLMILGLATLVLA
ncbi:hypothetical protein HDU97_009958 [Phlyctochytrium planicorne]|nr:hypothetical protein HDU97_009958 [Phlyctochytrium planicorne]